MALLLRFQMITGNFKMSNIISVPLVLQIRMSTRDNLGVIFYIAPLKRML